jgi:Cyclic nucleotide-binding domain
MTTMEIVGHASFGIGAVSYWVRDEIWLRGLLVLSFLTGIVYNALPPVGPLWLVVFWLSVYLAINTYRIITTLRETRSVRLDDVSAELRDISFPEFTPVEFAKLIRAGEWRTASPGEKLSREGEPINDLMVIQNGNVSVTVGDREVAQLKDGAIVGEMSFINEGPASATVTATEPTRYIAWPQASLRSLLMRNPSMLSAIRLAFSAELSRKLSTN